MAKRIKRLTRLQISEVSAVDAGAAVGARVVLMKRATGFNDAGELLIDGVPRWQRKKKAAGGSGKGDSLAKALAEIEANRAIAKSAAPLMGDTKMQTQEIDVVKAMSSRIAEIRKAFPTLSEAGAMARIAESRSPSDQMLWRIYKSAGASTGSIEKSVKVKKTLRHMDERITEIMKVDPTVRSRESAIGRIASSRLPSDAELWRDYRVASQQVDQVVLREDLVPVGKAAGLPDALEVLTETLDARLWDRPGASRTLGPPDAAAPPAGSDEFAHDARRAVTKSGLGPAFLRAVVSQTWWRVTGAAAMRGAPRPRASSRRRGKRAPGFRHDPGPADPPWL